MIFKNKSVIKAHISHKVMFTTLGASWQCACSVRVLNYLSTVRAVIHWNPAYLGKWGQRCRETDGIRLAFILKRSEAELNTTNRCTGSRRYACSAI